MKNRPTSISIPGFSDLAHVRLSRALYQTAQEMLSLHIMLVYAEAEEDAYADYTEMALAFTRLFRKSAEAFERGNERPIKINNPENLN